MHYLITGIAGFIGFHIARRLLSEGHQITGIDNLNNYYDVNLKIMRLDLLRVYNNFQFIKCDLEDKDSITQLFLQYKFQRVIHLGAQAGVRYSVKEPMAYAKSNLIGHLNILEGCRYQQVEHFIYASTSSVYGLNKKKPFSEQDRTDQPISFYAATKKANELMSYSYAHLYNLPTTGLRFFTVYGPWGRPDMSLFGFTKAILTEQPINIYNDGIMSRDFTYIDDVVEAVMRLQEIIPESAEFCEVESDYSKCLVPYQIYNIGNNTPVSLMDWISTLESVLGKTAIKNKLPMQPGDIHETYANTQALYQATGFKPKTSVKDGIKNFVNWYREFYNI